MRKLRTVLLSESEPVAVSVSEWTARRSSTRLRSWLPLAAGIRIPLLAVLLLAASSLHAAPATGLRIHAQSQPGDFPLVQSSHAAEFVIGASDFRVVSIAVNDLAVDVERVSGRKPAVHTTTAGVAGPIVLIGTLGRAPAIDALVAAGRLDVAALRGAWETFLIATVINPLPGAKSGLVIVGSDRRGTAFGVYELSQAIGVSPWYWWADVAPAHRDALFVAAGTHRLGPPSVKYRGIFINDEDWGLQPWAAQTFEPEHGGIGPKTYAKVFELLLRLKANTLWPAMHACTKPFNSFPENAALADDYAIVMGSSHAEPMLRNNVSEWPHDRAADYNYVTNRDGVRKYWEERVAANGRYENIYTVGMRGIHDSNMQGPKTDAERIQVLEQVFADQRAMLARHVRPDLEHVPQMFCAYKEVLDLYRQGLKVPDDVTIVWPDDNFGYVRSFASAEERKRSGGFGVYYHLSYLGAPLSYLWLCTTPPALVWEEMSKAYDQGAQRIWIVNVGDIKPAEIGTEFFLQMAWDINRWRRDNLPDYLAEWAGREFGAAHAREIAAIMADYYRLNYQRKPEHLQWWMPNEKPRPSPLTAEEVQQRLRAFAQLRDRAAKVRTALPAEERDAFFETVLYPVNGTALANERYFAGERVAVSGLAGAADEARAADARLKDETRIFSEQIAGGKWRGFIRVEPADDDWRSIRLAPWKIPVFPPKPEENPGTGGVIAIEADHFSQSLSRGETAAWQTVPGLGRTSEGAVAVFPTTAPNVALAKAATDAPQLDYAVNFAAAGTFTLQAYLIPTYPISGGSLRFAVALDDAPPRLIELVVNDGGAGWAQGVLDNTRIATTRLKVPTPGAHTLRVYGLEPGVVLDKLVIDCGGLQPSYLGPPETTTSDH
jgi:Glycosyl hydrolase family 115/Gylcosyl hydrolase family 115 C-terminal domain